MYRALMFSRENIWEAKDSVKYFCNKRRSPLVRISFVTNKPNPKADLS